MYNPNLDPVEGLVVRISSIPDHVLDHLAADPDVAGLVAQRATISDELWSSLLTRHKKNATVLTELARRALSEAQVIALIRAAGSRATALEVLLCYNEVNEDSVDALLSRPRPKSVIAQLYASCAGDQALRDRVGAHLEHVDRLTWMASAGPGLVDDETVLSYVQDLPNWWKGSKAYVKRADAYKALIENRPHLLAQLIDARVDGLDTAAASSRHLVGVDLQARILGTNEAGLDSLRAANASEYTQLALAHNPRTKASVLTALKASTTSYKVREAVESRVARSGFDEPFETVAEPDQISWLVRRAAPDARFGATKRPYDLAALAVNPNLGDGDARRVAAALSHPDAVDVLGHARTHALLTQLRTRYPVAISEEDAALLDTSGPKAMLMVRDGFTSIDGIGISVVEDIAAQRVLIEPYWWAPASALLASVLAESTTAWLLFVDMVKAHGERPFKRLAESAANLAGLADQAQ
jgi:hypothetical protein